MKIGVQVSSLKPLLTTAEGVREAFVKIAALGVDTVQLQWIGPAVSPEEIAAALGESGLQSVGVQDFSTEILKNTAYYTDLMAATDGIWLCPSRVPEHQKTREGLERYAQALEKLRDELAPRGQTLCFHPVAGAFAPIGGVCPVEFLLERLKWLDLCLDLYHVHRAGLGLRDTLRRWRGRVCMVHFKDFKKLPDGSEVLVPAGQGDIDWTGVAEACLETGVGYAFAEQERWEGDPYERLGEALGWLRRQCP